MTTDKNKEIEYVIDVKDVDFYYGKTQALSPP